MKALKKVLALCLAAILLLALSPAAFADGEQTATVIINGAAYGETYNFYKMFSVNSVVTEGQKTLISYEVNPLWADFFETNAAGSAYITLENGNPTWTGESTAAAYENFAKAAFAYVRERSLTADKTATFNGPEDKIGQTGDFTVDNLPLGYYLVDTSLGALLNLESAHANVTIQEKNSVPTFKKEVEVTPGNWGSSNTAKIGDTVKFKSEFTIGKGNDYIYYFRDTMSRGLTLNDGSIEVQVQAKDSTTATKVTAGYSKVTPDTGDTFTFGLDFTKAFIDQYREGTVVITYNAVLNENATIDDANPNPNNATLTYNNKTLKGHTDTYTYQFDLVKYYVNAQNVKQLLDGAEFKLFENAEGSGNAIKFVKNGAGTEYRVAKQDEEANATNTIVTLETGKINIKGLDKKTYYLEETKAPGGYNKLKQRVQVNLTNGSLKADADNTFNNGVQVENKSGTTLPSTGGMGTTLFYVVGGVLVVGAAVLLVTKKRMER